MSNIRIIKRSGEEVDFDRNKIVTAIQKANDTLNEQAQLRQKFIEAIAEEIEIEAGESLSTLNVEDIQNTVVRKLAKYGAIELAFRYENYRFKRALARKNNTTDDEILELVERNNEEVKQENSNKNPVINSTQRDYIAGQVSRDITNRILLDDDIVKAHNQGLIHFHDQDYYIQHMHNCCLVNLEDMLQNGTVISGTMIEPPKSFSTACNIATQAIAQVASSQYGGQSISLAHLAPFVDVSRRKIRKQCEEEFEGLDISEEKKEEIVKKRLYREIVAGIQTIQYQLITLMTTNGQTPFITVYMYLDEVPEGQIRDDLALIIEETLKQRIKGVQNEKGVYITPAFPKLIYTLDEDNITKDSKYWYLTELAAKCTAKRMVPDYISPKIMKEYKGDVYTCMGCRSFLTPDRFTDKGIGNIANAKNYKEGERKYYGRFNQGVVTVNLPYVACLSGGDMDKFWKIFDETLELCHKALRRRHERLLGTPSDVAPILWQHGALARLNKGEVIDKLLYDGYSTISLGYAGLYEMCQRMTGKSHTDPEGKPFALRVMQFMNDKCAEWKASENIDYSIYGTPLESTTYKFAKALQREFGVIPNVSDRNYITNSYHVHVAEKIDAFQKLKFESEFQKLSPGGAISYIEVPDLQNNIEAVLSVMQYIYDNIMYAELNTKSDYCQVCGYDGEMVIEENENKKLYWRCPNCGNTDQTKMNVSRRTCGYIGTNFWNQGQANIWHGKIA